MQRFKKFHPEDTDLFRPPCWSHIYGFRTEFSITQPSRLKTSGQVNLHHRGMMTGYHGPVAYAVRIGLRFKPPGSPAFASEVHGSPPPFIYGAISSGNIVNIDAHYADAALISDVILTQPGDYAISVWGISASTGAPERDGLIEINGDAGSFLVFPYHQFIVDVTDWDCAVGPQPMTTNGQWL